MENDIDYFKRPTLREYVKATFFTFAFYVLLSFTIALVFKLFFWWVDEPVPNAIYYIIVTYFITRKFKSFQCLYYRMQEVPFLTLTKEGIRMDRSMVKFPRASEWTGKIELNWSAIQQIETGWDSFIIYYQKNGKDTFEKVNLRWVKEKGKLLVTLKDECQKNKITWIEKTMD